MNTLPLRPNVCLLIKNREGKLFLAERAGSPGIWQFPQGGAEPELTLEENALKEAHEELGVGRAKLRVIKQLRATHSYEFDKAPAYAVGKWRGQAQTFWLLEFVGKDEEIDPSRGGELTKWKWCTITEVKELAEPKRLAGYAAALEEVEPLLCTEDGFELEKHK